MSDSTFLLYGATGYTGKLIAQMAAEYGLTPILAGRNEQALAEVAAGTGLEYRVFALDNAAALEAALEDVSVVLHAAGPFKYTALPMVEACMATQTHYVDITGEIEVFEALKQKDAAAREAGIVLMPGAGFDVAPTDCMARFLHEHLPDAEMLQLAFWQRGSTFSRGTARTMVEHLGEPGAVREKGVIKRVAVGHKSMWIPFSSGKKAFAMTIPWGDISTAFHTTGIPHIETYMAVPPQMFRMARLSQSFGWLLKLPLVKRMLLKRIDRQPPGPNQAQLEGGKCYVWGRVQNAAGDAFEARMECPEGYLLTAISSLLITRQLLRGIPLTGYQTPASAFGADFVLEIPGTSREVLDQ